MIRTLVLVVTSSSLLFAALAHSQIVTGVTTATGPTGTTVTTTTVDGPAATKAEADAATAAIGAQAAAVPGSGLTPSTSLQSGAGIEEANLATAVAIQLAAKQITTTSALNKDGVLVFVGNGTAPDNGAWLMYQNRTKTLATNLEADIAALSQLLKKKPEQMEAILGTAGGVVFVQKALSYLITNYQVGGSSLTVDDYLMNISLMAAKPGWKLASQHLDASTPADVQAPLDKLNNDMKAAAAAMAAAANKQVDLAGVTTPLDVAAQAKVKADAIKAQAAIVGGDVAATNAYLATLGTGGLSSVLQARTVDLALSGTGAGVVYVKLHSASGGVITKTNLWTNLGLSIPVYNSVGLVVSYVYYATATANPQAGVIEVATPYNAAGKLPDLLKAAADGKCNKQAAEQTAGAKKVCPAVYVLPVD